MALVDVSNRLLPYVFEANRPRVNQEQNRRNRTRDASYIKSFEYINGLPVPVTVTDRDGVAVVIPPRDVYNVQCTNSFDVTVEYAFNNISKIDADATLDEDYISDKPHVHAFADGARWVKKVGSNKPRQLSSVGIIHSFSTKDFRTNNGDIYVPQLDVVLSLRNEINHIPTHPYSEHGNIMRNKESEVQFSYGIIANDPDRVFGERFINLYGEIFRIPIIRDTTSPSGLVIKGNVPVADETTGSLVRRRFLTFDEAEKLKIFYYSQQEAEEYGDINAKQKRELEQDKLNLEREKLKLEEQKVELQGQVQQRDAEIKKINAEREIEAAERKRQEDLYRAELEEMARARERINQKHNEVLADLKHKREIEGHEHEYSMAVRSRMLAEDKHHMDRSKAESNAVLDVVKWVGAAVVGVIGIVAAAIKIFGK